MLSVVSDKRLLPVEEEELQQKSSKITEGGNAEDEISSAHEAS